MSEPSSSAGNGGRGPGGRFAPGNKAGKGNPNNRRAQQIRSAIIKAVKPREMAEAARKLLQQAMAGDRQAFAELCDRVIGKPIPLDVEERIAELERLVNERQVDDE